MWDSYRAVNICVIGLPEGEDREKGTDEILETIMMENFPESMVDTNPVVQEAQRVASRINAPQETVSKIKGKFLEEVRRKKTYRGTKIRINPSSPQKPCI